MEYYNPIGASQLSDASTSDQYTIDGDFQHMPSPSQNNSEGLLAWFDNNSQFMDTRTTGGDDDLYDLLHWDGLKPQGLRIQCSYPVIVDGGGDGGEPQCESPADLNSKRYPPLCPKHKNSVRGKILVDEVVIIFEDGTRKPVKTMKTQKGLHFRIPKFHAGGQMHTLLVDSNEAPTLSPDQHYLTSTGAVTLGAVNTNMKAAGGVPSLAGDSLEAGRVTEIVLNSPQFPMKVKEAVKPEFDDLKRLLETRGRPGEADLAYWVSHDGDFNVSFGTVVGIRGGNPWSISLNTDNCSRIGVIPDKPYAIQGIPVNNKHSFHSRVSIMGKVKVNLGPELELERVDAAKMDRGEYFVFASGRHDGYASLESKVESLEHRKLLIGQALRIVPKDEKPEETRDIDTFVETWIPDNTSLRLTGPQRLENMQDQSLRGMKGVSGALEARLPIRCSRKRLHSEYPQLQTIKRMEQLLHEEGNELCALWGPKGVGKSSIAQQFIDYLEKPGEYDVIWWVDCSTEERSANDFLELCRLFPDIDDELRSQANFNDISSISTDLKKPGSGRSNLSLAETVKLAIDLMWRKLQKMSVLMILDDFPASMSTSSERFTKEWMETHLPKRKMDSSSHLIFTANSKEAATTLCTRNKCASPIEIAGLETDQCAIEFLKSIIAPDCSNESLSDDVCRTLAVEQLHRHPQGIYVAAKVIAYQKQKDVGKTLEDISNKLVQKTKILPPGQKKTTRGRSNENLRFEIFSAYEFALSTIGFTVKNAKLEVGDQSDCLPDVELARELLLLLSCIDTKEIALPLVGDIAKQCSAWNTQTSDGDDSHSDDTDEADENLIDDAVQVLTDVGLVVKADNKKLFLHSITTNVLRELTRSQLGEYSRRAMRVLANAVKANFVEGPLQRCGHSLRFRNHYHFLCCDYRIGFHILHCWEHIRLSKNDADFCCIVFGMMDRFSQVLVCGRHFQQIEKIVDLIRELSKQPAAEGDIAGKIRRCLYDLSLVLGNFSEALKYAKDELSEYQGLLSHSHVKALKGIGELEMARGNMIAALDYYSKSLGMLKELKDVKETALTLRRMGELEVERGDLSAAHNHYSDSLDILKKLKSNRILEAQREMEGASTHREKFLATYSIWQHIFDDEPKYDIAVTLRLIAELEEERRNFSAAHSRYSESLDMLKDLDGDEPYKEVAVIQRKMGELEEKLENSSAASNHYSKSLEICERRMRDVSVSSPEFVENLEYMGDLETRRGNPVAADDHYSRALDSLWQISHGDEPSRVKSVTLGKMGSLEVKRGNLSAARDYYSKALEVSRQVCPKLSAETLLVLGHVMWQDGNLPAAYDHYSECLMLLKRYQEEPHQSIVATLNSLGSLEVERGNLSNAYQHYSDSLRMLRNLPADQTNVGDIQAKLAEIKRNQCDVCGRKFDKRCGGCLRRRYCGYMCQKKDWKTHKRECKK